jgi:hypothetical protein
MAGWREEGNYTKMDVPTEKYSEKSKGKRREFANTGWKT